MYRPAVRCLSQQPLRIARQTSGRRFVSTAPPHQKSRSWRNSTLRWTIAAAGVYWYNTSSMFVDEPALHTEAPQPEDASLPTLASLSPSSRFTPPTPENPPTAPLTPSSSSPPSLDPKAPAPHSTAPPLSATGTPDAPLDASPEALEEEAASQGAFNEETGEINWDCPCLGGMAYGPCGAEFREAFSCFVYSKEEPKGMDCIERFKAMQGCFRLHPDVYGAELEDEEAEEADAEVAVAAAGAMPDDVPAVAAAEGEAVAQLASAKAGEDAPADVKASVIAQEIARTKEEKKSIYDSEDERGSAPATDTHDTGKQGRLLPDRTGAKSSTRGSDEDELLPKAAHDATSSSEK